MGLYKYLKDTWQNNKKLDSIIKERMIKYRREPTIVKIDKPTRLDKARRLGYKAKQGIVVCRVKIIKGARRRPSIARGRKPSKYGLTHISTTKNLRAIAEQRANRKMINMEVLGSYYIADDSKNVWYEVILVDPNHPAIQKDKDLNWIIQQRGRAFRGLTAASKRSNKARRKK